MMRKENIEDRLDRLEKKIEAMRKGELGRFVLSLLTPADVAGILKISKETVYRMLKNEELPAIKFNKDWRIKMFDLQQYLDSHSTGGLK